MYKSWSVTVEYLPTYLPIKRYFFFKLNKINPAHGRIWLSWLVRKVALIQINPPFWHFSPHFFCCIFWHSLAHCSAVQCSAVYWSAVQCIYLLLYLFRMNSLNAKILQCSRMYKFWKVLVCRNSPIGPERKYIWNGQDCKIKKKITIKSCTKFSP